MTDSDLLDFEELRKFIRREHGPIGWEYQVGVMQERAERQAARIRELEDALRPFAQHDWSFSSAPDEAPIQVPGLAIEDITLGDLKRAAAALRGKRGDSHE